MPLGPEILRQLLTELSDWLDHVECDPVEWVVCGGAAMALQNLRVRTTRDVDILGNWDSTEMQVLGIDAFPTELRACIERVVREHPALTGLGAGWINLGPRQLVSFGLPLGFEERLTTMRFGARLTLHLLGRTDLIALKFYAAIDEGGTRQPVHLDDLAALDPTFDEMDAALEWARGLPDFDLKRNEAKEVIRGLGHEGLDYYV